MNLWSRSMEKLRSWEFILHKTKFRVLVRFLLTLLILVGYFTYVSYHFGAKDGLLITMLTWSFFVFCTPIADAGILVDLPVRLLLKMRMLHSELMVWILATLFSGGALLFAPAIFEQTIILSLFKHILTQPFPFWGIILLSASGTFLSILFADELVDVAEEKARHLHHRHRWKLRIIIFVGIILLILVLYNYLLNQLGVQIALF